MAKDKLQLLADELEQIMDKRAEVEAEYEAQLEPLKEYEKQTRTKLLETLSKKGWKFVKATSGLGFGVTDGKTTFTIKEGREEEALAWAKTEYPSILSIAAPKLAKVLKPMLTIPEFFEKKVGEPHLSVRSNEDDAILKP